MDQLYVLLVFVMSVITPDVKSLVVYVAYDLLYSGDLIALLVFLLSVITLYHLSPFRLER